MASKPSPKKNSKIIQKYIDKYTDRTRYKHETIYTMDPEDLAEICDFADSKKAKVFVCFYNFSAEKYDKMDINDLYAFAEGRIMWPRNKIRVTDNGIVFGINVCVPAREGVVDKALINEILSHELAHAYRAYNEYIDGHISYPNPSKRRKIDAETAKNKNVKYTYTNRQDRYNDMLLNIKNDKSIRDMFYWVGYSLTTDEINATLAGVDAFLYEHNGDYKKLPQCRSIMFMNDILNFFNQLQENATDKDWEHCPLYIHERRGESVNRLKKRYIAYYNKLFKYFDTRVQKIVDKYKIRKAQEKVLSRNIAKNPVLRSFIENSFEI